MPFAMYNLRKADIWVELISQNTHCELQSNRQSYATVWQMELTEIPPLPNYCDFSYYVLLLLLLLMFRRSILLQIGQASQQMLNNQLQKRILSTTTTHHR